MTRYIHGTSQEEQGRLSLLNDITNASFINFLGDLSDKTICDFGCGTGHLIDNIVSRFPSARPTGIDISLEQLKIAEDIIKKNPRVTLLNADALKNTLPDNYFDVTYARYLLEHLSDPKRAAREMLRVTKEGGQIIAQENDLHNVIFYPDIAGFTTVLEQFCLFQVRLGGDPYIGRKLYDIFKEAGASAIRLSYEPEIYTEDEPERFQSWLENTLQILLGAREEMLRKKIVDKIIFSTVIANIKNRIENPRGVALFHWNRVRAIK